MSRGRNNSPEPYAKRDRHSRDSVLKDMWKRYGTLYPVFSPFNEDKFAERTRLDLEKEGHLSPERIPPEELREMVRYGR